MVRASSLETPAWSAPIGEHLAVVVPKLRCAVRKRLRRAGAVRWGDLGDIEADILQEIALVALQRDDQRDRTRDPAAWLFGISLNLLRRWGRHRQAQRWPADKRGVEQLAGVTAYQDPERWASMREVARLLERLRTVDAEVLRVVYLEHDCDVHAASAALGLTQVATRVRCHRACRRARTLLDCE